MARTTTRRKASVDATKKMEEVIDLEDSPSPAPAKKKAEADISPQQPKKKAKVARGGSSAVAEDDDRKPAARNKSGPKPGATAGKGKSNGRNGKKSKYGGDDDSIENRADANTADNKKKTKAKKKKRPYILIKEAREADHEIEGKSKNAFWIGWRCPVITTGKGPIDSMGADKLKTYRDSFEDEPDYKASRAWASGRIES